MKKLLTITTACCFSLISYSQVYVGGVNINKLPVTYISIQAVSAPWGTKGDYALIDYGQDGENKVTDSSGKRMAFNGELAIVNYLANNGWELLFQRINSSNTRPEFILKRKAESE